MTGALPAPDWLAHADWGSAPAKRVVATAERHDAGYLVHAPRVVGDRGSLTERLGVGRDALLGFDFPVGVPRRYAELAGIENFGAWLRDIDLGAPFFQVATTLDEVSLERPFFPARLATRSPGIKREFHERLGFGPGEALRLCDHAHARRRAASELFWTLGPQSVGKAALSGWRDALRPALDEPRSSYRLWPFDGEPGQLLDDDTVDAVIVEAYPAEAYGRLGLRMGRAGTAKTRQASRRDERDRLVSWSGERGVRFDAELAQAIEDGFGAHAGGEDAFDATVGVLGMIDTLADPPDPLHPVDPAVRALEGWIFGQLAPTDASSG